MTKGVKNGVWILVAASLFPLPARGAKLALDSCESQARAAFQKKAVEVGMATIVGTLNEVEEARERESLQAKLEKEKAKCLHLARSAASHTESL